MKKYAILVLASAFVGCGRPAVPNSGVTPDLAPTSSTDGIKSYGTINGGGGVGLRCGEHLEMLDLYEARQSGLSFNALYSQSEAVKFVAERIARHFWNVETIEPAKHAIAIAEHYIAPIFEGRPFQNSLTGKSEQVLFVDQLPLSNDFGKYKIPPGCVLEQVAFLSDTQTELSIVKSAWAKLDWLSKSVLAAHEVVYLMERREGLEGLWPNGAVRTSESTRRFVGHLLSTKSLVPKSDSVPKNGSLYVCDSKDRDVTPTIFYAIRDAQKKWTVVFKTILGKSSLYQLIAPIRKMSDFNEVIAVDSPTRTRLRVTLQERNEELKFISFYYSDESEKTSGYTQVGPTQEITCQLF